MPGTPLKLGPFAGGLNTSSDPTAIADSELADCVNFELDIDFSLKSRPPIQSTTDMAATWTERIVILGVAVFASGDYIIGSNANGVFQFNSGVWTQISSTFQAVSMAQYNDQVYLLSKPNATSSLAKWSPLGGFVAVSPANLHTMMGTDKGGGSLTIFKERLFIVPGKDKVNNTARLIFSDAGFPETYTATTQFVDVHPGDGQKLIDLISYEDNLVLFKNDSTYVMSYTSRPTDAELLNINTNIGTTQRNCVVSYENSVFVYHEGWVYEMVNYDFKRINTKVPFLYDATAPSPRAEEVFLSILGDRLICRYYNRIYVYGLRTKTWSRWESTNAELHNFGPLVALPSNVTQAVNDKYYAGSSILANERVFVIKDGFSPTDTEKIDTTPVDIFARIKTKNYDVANTYQFKKMSWWGADVVTNNAVLGTANPVIFGFKPTWGMLFAQNRPWLDLNTWSAPLQSASIIVAVGEPGTGEFRRFLKFPKSLRFRQINFELKFSTSGATIDGPVRLFTLTLFASTKQVVTQAVN